MSFLMRVRGSLATLTSTEMDVAALVSTRDPRVAAHADRILEIHDGLLNYHGKVAKV